MHVHVVSFFCRLSVICIPEVCTVTIIVSTAMIFLGYDVAIVHYFLRRRFISSAQMTDHSLVHVLENVHMILRRA